MKMDAVTSSTILVLPTGHYRTQKTTACILTTVKTLNLQQIVWECSSIPHVGLDRYGWG